MDGAVDGLEDPPDGGRDQVSVVAFEEVLWPHPGEFRICVASDLSVVVVPAPETPVLVKQVEDARQCVEHVFREGLLPVHLLEGTLLEGLLQDRPHQCENRQYGERHDVD